MSDFMLEFADDDFLEPFQSGFEFPDGFTHGLDSAPECWQDSEILGLDSFFSLSFPPDFENMPLEDSPGLNSVPGCSFLNSPSDTAVSGSDQLHISLLSCNPQGEEVIFFHETLLKPSELDHGDTNFHKTKGTTFEECLHEFEARVSNTGIGRKRKRFSPKRRTECQLNIPCSTCVKSCGSMKLGRILCTRQSLVSVRYTADLWNRVSDASWLSKQFASFAGPVRAVHVLLDTPNFRRNQQHSDLIVSDLEAKERFATHPTLLLQVQSISLLSSESDQCGQVSDSHPFNAQSDSNQHYAIPRELLPDLEEIEVWGLDDFETTVEKWGTHPSLGFFRSAFFEFARKYCACEKALPLKDMVDKAVRLTALHGLWRRSLIEESKGRERVSDVVHIQLSMIIAKGITDFEIDLLARGPGKENMLPIWTFLWLLIWTYRETVDAWSSPQHEKKGLPQLAQHIYDMLVTLYAGLFRTSSPLNLNWLFDDIYKLFGRDSKLIDSMGTIKTEFTHFDKFRGHSHAKDALMRKLIFERGIKHLNRPSQDSSFPAYYDSSKIYYPIRVGTSSDLDPSVSAPWVSFIQSN